MTDAAVGGDVDRFGKAKEELFGMRAAASGESGQTDSRFQGKEATPRPGPHSRTKQLGGNRQDDSAYWLLFS